MALAQTFATPALVERQYVATVGHGGGAFAFIETHATRGPLQRLANESPKHRALRETALNEALARQLGANGVSFNAGRLQASPAARPRSRGDGTLLLSFSGISYTARALTAIVVVA